MSAFQKVTPTSALKKSRFCVISKKENTLACDLWICWVMKSSSFSSHFPLSCVCFFPPFNFRLRQRSSLKSDPFVRPKEVVSQTAGQWPTWPKRFYPGRTIEAAREEATRLSTVLVGSLGGFGSGLVDLWLKHLMACWWELSKSHCFNYFRLNHCSGLQILRISSPFFSRWVLNFCPFYRRMRWLQVKLPGGCGQWKVRSLRSLNFNHDQQPISRPFSSETVVGKQEKGSISVSKHVAGNKDRPHIKSFQILLHNKY